MSHFLEHSKKLELLFCDEITTAEETKLEFTFKPNEATNNDFYKDEPYEYHAKLVKMLYYTCVGKSGVYINEVKVRKLFKLKYIFEVLNRPDSFTLLAGDDENMKEDKYAESHGRGLGDLKIDKLKIQLLKLVFYVFFESEKISEEVTINKNLILEFFRKEADRIELFEADMCSPLYYKYVFEVLTKILSVYYTNSFIKTLADGEDETDYQ